MKAFTLATPRYAVESASGTHCDVFNKRANAIRAAIQLATEYPGMTFQVVKKAMHKRTVVFSFMMEVQADFDDMKDVYGALMGAAQKKLNHIRFWRKLDEPGD
jgi:hypothetical protein